MNKIFVPILRSKQQAQYKALKSLSSLKDFSKVSTRIIPYIELKKDITFATQNKYRMALENTTHFIEYYDENFNENNFKDLIAKTKSIAFNCNTIPSLKLDFKLVYYHKNIIIDLIKFFHTNNQKFALRVTNYINLNDIKEVLLNLNENDFLILDNEFSSMQTKIILSNYHSIAKTLKNKIIFFSTERSQQPAKVYENLNYTNFCNYDLINFLKDNKGFYYHGIGSYCGAKADNNEIGNSKVSIEAIFFEYSFLMNKFFIIKSAIKGNISTIYTELTKYLGEIIDKNLNANPLKEILELNGYSLVKLKEIILKQKSTHKNSTASNYIELTIEHYIEEIIHYYLIND